MKQYLLQFYNDFFGNWEDIQYCNDFDSLEELVEIRINGFGYYRIIDNYFGSTLKKYEKT